MNRTTAAIISGVLLVGAGCATTGQAPPVASAAKPAAVLPMGYLAKGEIPNSQALLPPPPADGSGARARDEEASKAALALRGSARWDMAANDAVLSFPKAAETFSCAVGVEISEKTTPHVVALLRRTLLDAGMSTSPTKDFYKRARPFMVNNEPTCTPGDEAGLRRNGSYPSGHSAAGWTWGLVLAQAAPDKAEALVARGRAFGQSRVVCNVHWLSDAEEGRIMGSAVFARLQSNAEFQADVAAARSEIAAARSAGKAPTRDCAAEAAALAAG